MSYKLKCEKKVNRPCPKRGTAYRRVLSVKNFNGRQLQHHATKGYRSYRA